MLKLQESQIFNVKSDMTSLLFRRECSMMSSVTVSNKTCLFCSKEGGVVQKKVE